MEIIFTKHANEKFKILEKHQFKIKKSEVIETVRNPERADLSKVPLIIVQRKINKAHF
ncbi:MAG: hypothetical protein QME61_02395 [Patescibacteria group bacterium]|nr:hypothetical protein [Patescibacteria group bacterium]